MEKSELLETKIRSVVAKLAAFKEQSKHLEKENIKLESQCRLLEEENMYARKIISQNNILMGKHKKVKERIQRLWENISRAI
ncbi:MAG: hypothetical protein ABII23_07995 [bacterium]